VPAVPSTEAPTPFFIGETEITLNSSFFGDHIDLSHDGLRLAISNWDGNATASVTIYVRRNVVRGSWSLLGPSIPLKPGRVRDLALTRDGTHIAVINAWTLAVQVYELDFAIPLWNQVGTDLPLPSNEEPISVAIADNGMTVSVGIPGKFVDNTDGITGTIRVYRFMQGAWLPLGSDGELDGDSARATRFGGDVALSSDGEFVVGITSTSTLETSYFQAYQFDNGQWVPAGRITSTSPNPDYFNVELSADGTKAGIESVGSNSAKFYEYDGQNWNERSNQTLPGGFGMSLSTSGNSVAITNSLTKWVELYGFFIDDNWLEISGGPRTPPKGTSRWSKALSLSGDGYNIAVSGQKGLESDPGFVRIYFMGL